MKLAGILVVVSLMLLALGVDNAIVWGMLVLGVAGLLIPILFTFILCIIGSWAVWRNTHDKEKK